MKFPLEKGSSQHKTKAAYGHLVPGQLYEVVKVFSDWSRCEHPVGERWVFLGYNFFPYEEGLTLYVGNEAQTAEAGIRMQLYPDRQGPIMDNFEQYVRPVSGWHHE